MTIRPPVHVPAWFDRRWRDGLALAIVSLWPVIHFLPVASGDSVWYATDIIRLFHPFAVELSAALGRDSLPLWSSGLLGGFPLLAEGQVGALYPVNIVLLKLLPPHMAVSFGILFHLVWAGCGMYICARSQRLSIPAALLAGVTLSFSGFALGQMSHPSIIAAFSWLPWLIAFQEQARRALTRAHGSGKWIALSTLGLGIQFLAGSVQIAFLNVLAYLFLGFLGEWCDRQKIRSVTHPIAAVTILTILPVILGLGIAAAQLLPTNELLGYSVRNETNEGFLTSYSLPIPWLLQFVLPFSQGEPAEGNIEYWGYIGITAFLLALSAPIMRRDRKIGLIMAFAAGSLILSLGGLFPFFRLLLNVPIVGQFRVPARYLHLSAFGMTLLSAIGLDAASKRLTGVVNRRVALWVGIAILLVLGSIKLTSLHPSEFWLEGWKYLPLAFLAIGLIGAFLVHRRGISAPAFNTVVLMLVAVDMTAFSAPFLSTIDSLTPTVYAQQVPRSLAVLDTTERQGRIWTDLSTFPSVPALKGSLFPNTALTYGRESTQAFSSLALSRQEALVNDPSPTILNLMNVRFLLVPLEPRPRTKSSAPPRRMGLDVLDNEVMIPPTPATRIVVSSYTEEAMPLAEGTSVGELSARLVDGGIAKWPIRVGIETSDWDYDRKAAVEPVASPRAPVSHDFGAYWRSYGRSFDGHTYLAGFELPKPSHVEGVVVRSVRPGVRLEIETLRLEDSGTAFSLAELSGKNEFRLSYQSDTVAIWENLNVLPRAFLVHSAHLADDSSAFDQLMEDRVRPDREVLLDRVSAVLEPDKSAAVADDVKIVQYEPDRVSIQATTDRRGLLVLADSWYPGWQATIDGEPTLIYRADLIFRAVALGPGTHTIIFEYRPSIFLVGVTISVISLVLVGILAVFVARLERTGRTQSSHALPDALR